VNETDITPLTVGDRQQTITYVGGVGNRCRHWPGKLRPCKKDIVSAAEYDVLGRQLKRYLPYVKYSGRRLHYRTTALSNGAYTASEQYIFWASGANNLAHDPKPYSTSEIEPSHWEG